MKKQIKYLLTGVALVLFIIYMTDYDNISNFMAMLCPYLTGIALGFWCGDIKENNRRNKR